MKRLKMEPPAKYSISKSNQGVSDPEHVTPIADSKHKNQSRMIGIMYRGNGYGEQSAWIACNQNHLLDIER